MQPHEYAHSHSGFYKPAPALRLPPAARAHRAHPCRPESPREMSILAGTPEMPSPSPTPPAAPFTHAQSGHVCHHASPLSPKPRDSRTPGVPTFNSPFLPPPGWLGGRRNCPPDAAGCPRSRALLCSAQPLWHPWALFGEDLAPPFPRPAPAVVPCLTARSAGPREQAALLAARVPSQGTQLRSRRSCLQRHHLLPPPPPSPGSGSGSAAAPAPRVPRPHPLLPTLPPRVTRTRASRPACSRGRAEGGARAHARCW